MKKINAIEIIGIMYVLFFTLWAATDVGKTPDNLEPYSWYLPILIFFIFGTAVFVGWMAGKLRGDDE